MADGEHQIPRAAVRGVDGLQMRIGEGGGIQTQAVELMLQVQGNGVGVAQARRAPRMAQAAASSVSGFTVSWVRVRVWMVLCTTLSRMAAASSSARTSSWMFCRGVTKSWARVTFSA